MVMMMMMTMTMMKMVKPLPVERVDLSHNTGDKGHSGVPAWLHV